MPLPIRQLWKVFQSVEKGYQRDGNHAAGASAISPLISLLLPFRRSDDHYTQRLGNELRIYYFKRTGEIGKLFAFFGGRTVPVIFPLIWMER